MACFVDQDRTRLGPSQAEIYGVKIIISVLMRTINARTKVKNKCRDRHVNTCDPAYKITQHAICYCGCFERCRHVVSYTETAKKYCNVINVIAHCRIVFEIFICYNI